jgi:hypothetical protein
MDKFSVPTGRASAVSLFAVETQEVARVGVVEDKDVGMKSGEIRRC